MKALAYFDHARTVRKSITLLEAQLAQPPKHPLSDEQEAIHRKLLQERLTRCRQQLQEIQGAIEQYVPEERSFRDRREQYRLSDEQLYLECRYIQGLTIEETAEAMAISRDTAYRIRRRIAEKELDPRTHRLRLQEILTDPC